MPFVLDRLRTASLCAFVDQRVQRQGCDHSHRFSREWAAAESIPWDDLLDILEDNGAHCDCEVVLNLPEDENVRLPQTTPTASDGNPWLLPPGFVGSKTDSFSKAIVCKAGVGRNTHTLDGELLIPAPHGAKPRGRVRKLVHFFIGCRSGKATEVGVVQSCDPLTAADFASQVADSGIDDFDHFTFREAAFVLSRVAMLNAGTTVGTDFSERIGIASKHEELTIHRVILRR